MAVGERLEIVPQYSFDRNDYSSEAISKAINKTVLHWETEDNGIATVNENGQLSRIGGGETLLTVTDKNREIVASSKVVVKVPAKSLETPEDITIAINKTPYYTLEAKVYPNDTTDKTIYVSSSDEEVVSVQNERLYAHKEGEAVITVSVQNTDIANTISVHVIIEPESIYFSDGDKSLYVGDKTTLRLYAMYDEEKIMDFSEVTIEVDNPDVIAVDAGDSVLNIDAVNAGNAVITVDYYGHTSSCNISVSNKPKTNYGEVVPASYGNTYASIECKKAGIDTSIIWGDDETCLGRSSYVSQYVGSKQIGDIGGHLLCAHNYGVFSKLARVSLGDTFIVRTAYGTYVYQVDFCGFGTVTEAGDNIVSADGVALIDLSDTEDRLYMYTCYPFGYYGATSQRYVVRATIVS